MRLTAWEEERLLIFSAAELARRHRDRGLLLNAPEVVALICDTMLVAARAGATYEEVEAAGREAVTAEQALPGVAALIDEVRLEVLFDDGVRLVVLLEPLGRSGDDAPGAIRRAPVAERDDVGRVRDLVRIQLEVHNRSNRVVRVSSHYPFERVNRRLDFDRGRATGFRLDLPAGSTERWGPGETRTVDLVRPG
ncbi:MAG: urease, gamma subunit [Chloroflexota bacterium]|jgi:urease subunit gamma/beta|nr:urease, gamma subunit [Chloroflexota bacterium]